MSSLNRFGVGLWVLLWCSVGARAGDWPQWRYEAGRGAVSPEMLPDELHLQWARELPEPRPAWPKSQRWLRFDESYSPVAAGKLLVVPSMVTDRVTAYDTETGTERWRFYTDGPVRFAPIVHDGRVYAGSDDGHLYCLSAAEGDLLWRFRGGPTDRKVLGNERLISTWPIRGGPVLWDGKIYFTAGIWPFMGIFVHAVDAETGKSVWTNSGYATTWTVQPHNSPAFGSLVPRGHLAATGCGLVVPGGRTEPGCFELETGDFWGFSFGGKGAGSHHVTARGDWLFVTGTMRQIVDGKTLLSTRADVHDNQALYGIDGDEIFAQGLEIEEQTIPQRDRKGRIVYPRKPRLRDLWKLRLPEAPGRLFVKAGPRFYAGKQGQVAAIEVDPKLGKAEIVWKGAIEGTRWTTLAAPKEGKTEITWHTLEATPWTMLAADEKLFVVTTDGSIHCFGAKEVDSHIYSDALARAMAGSGLSIPFGSYTADEVLKLGRGSDGYCVMFGLNVANVARSLMQETTLRVIVIDPHWDGIDSFRREMSDAGLYGTRIAAHVGDPATFPLPPYLASLVYVDGSLWEKAVQDAKLVKSVFRALRPYGGTAFLPMDAKRLERLVEEIQLEGARVVGMGSDRAKLVREGPLPGAADWTHQYADPAGSVVSKDQRVKAPLGLLWFGGPPNDQVLPRHGHGPSPQVAGGRLFIEGRNMLRALDIYTGRLLWQKELPDLGRYYDNTSHQPGANEIGSNYVSLQDSVYVVYGGAILKLDAASGELQREFKLEGGPGNGKPNWGFLAAYEDLLIATSTPVEVAQWAGWMRAFAGLAGRPKQPTLSPSAIQRGLAPGRYASASRRLVVMNRNSGQRLWDREAKYGFRHNNIAVGAGKLFCIDGFPGAKRDAPKPRGAALADYTPRLVALDVRTGREIWSSSEDVFGTFLNYSEEHDVLLQAGSAFRDRAADESDTGMVAYRGRDGSVLWKNLGLRHAGPCMLHHDTIITQGPAYSLLTGQPKLGKHPLTDEPLPWRFTRNYGCNTAIASEHLLTFRSAAAGYYDLATDGGTGNLGGFKSGCTSNLIVAGGLLSAPEYTRTCQCRYQNQTSLALIHDPGVEMWTFNAVRWDGKPVRRVGINFGASGDRRSPGGTLWMDYPSVGGPSPDLPVDLRTERPTYFRHHSSRVQVAPDSGALNWVAASGIRGAGRLAVTLARDASAPPRDYTVRLHFAEVEQIEPGQRVFSVRLQDREVLTELDIIKEVGPMTATVKEYKGVEVAGRLEVSLVPARADASVLPPLLCGIEIVAEGW